MAAGESIPIEEVPDEVFSSKLIGDGIAILPQNGSIYAPCDGVISMVMERTKHAVGILNADGMELLVHVGLETVTLMGEGFQVFVKEGDRVSAGERLLAYDEQILQQAGIHVVVMLIVVQSHGHPLRDKLVHRQVTVGDPLMKYR